MVQLIVGAHDGRITIDSDVDMGATFRIYLPAIERERPWRHPSREKPKEPSPEVLKQ